MMRTNLVLSFTALLALAGCMAPPAAAPLTQPIINGTLDDGDPAIVMVIAQVPGSMSASLCTGEVISPHVVLTAAHCVSPDTVGAGAKFVVFTGTMLSQDSPKEQFLPVTETHFVSTFAYNPMTGGDQDDVAVVILESPTTITPIPFNHFPLEDSAKQQPARIVGFGLTDGKDTTGQTAGTRHQAPTMIFDIQPKTITLYDKMHSNCEGDSGGPALLMLDGKEQIVGLTQVGYVGCPVDMGSTDTRVDPYVDFIDQYVAMFDPPALAGGAICTGDSDCAPLTCGSTSIGMICEQPCDPKAMTSSCPMGTRCVDLDGKTMCATKKGHSGCAMAGGGAGGGALGLLLLAALLGLGWRRARS
jgi:secreted trypsin-like serine protease